MPFVYEWNLENLLTRVEKEKENEINDSPSHKSW